MIHNHPASPRIRSLSPYNKFMQEELVWIKANFPEIDHRQAFRMAAEHWGKVKTSGGSKEDIQTIRNEILANRV